MRLSEYASTQRTYGSRKVPRSVQQSIPIDQIYEDGTWRCGNVYSQMWSMPDINFTMSDEDNKAKILNLLGKVYMGVPSDCWLKICIVSQRMDEKSFRENVLLHRNLDGLDKWRVERNRRIRQCVQDAGNVVQHKYLILSTNKQNVTDARSRLRQVQGNLLAELSNLGCTIKPMTNNERLEVLHNFFRRGEEGRFQFSFDDYGKLGNDFRNTIAPDAMRCTTQYAKIDDGFAKAMTIAQYPQQLSDNFVATLLQQVPYIVLSIDITPVETEDAMREIEASQMKIDSEKYRANRRNVENLDFMATISPRNQQQEKYTAEIRNAICEGDQQVFMVLLSVAFFADTLEEIKQETDALQSAAANFNCRFTEMRFQQENCFNTAMPYGLRRVESSHMMLTRSVTALVPFVAQEVQSPQGMAVRHKDAQRNIRLDKISPRFSEDALRSYFQELRKLPPAMQQEYKQQTVPHPPRRQPKEQPKPVRRRARYCGKLNYKCRKITGFMAFYYRYCALLRKAYKGKVGKRCYYLLRDDFLKYNRYRRQCDLLWKRQITTLDELLTYKENLQAEYSTLTAQRRALYRGKSKTTPADYSEQIQALTARIRELRREITTCADIEMDCEMVQDKVQRAAHRRENPPRERIHRRAY